MVSTLRRTVLKRTTDFSEVKHKLNNTHTLDVLVHVLLHTRVPAGFLASPHQRRLTTAGRCRYGIQRIHIRSHASKGWTGLVLEVWNQQKNVFPKFEIYEKCVFRCLESMFFVVFAFFNETPVSKKTCFLCLGFPVNLEKRCF